MRPAATRAIEPDQRHLHDCYEAVEWIVERLEGSAVAAGNALAESMLDYLREERITRLRTDAPPFFGRVDTDEGVTLYIGGQAIRRPDLELLAISWRAPAAGAFYRATAGSRHGIEFRRRYGIADRRIVAHSDEDLARGRQGDLTAAIIEHVGNAQVGAMQDIMTTITPEQHEVIALPRVPALVVQGGPGTGKTAVGLHRAAWLLYQGGPVARAGMLVVGPTRRFVDYVEGVLPALGEASVEHLPLQAIGACRARLRLVDERCVGLLGDARMITALERALWRSLGAVGDAITCNVAGKTVRLTRQRVEALRDEARASVRRYGAARERFRTLLVDDVAAEVAATRSVSEADAAESFRRSPAYQQLMTRVWPAVNPTRLLERLFTSRAFFVGAAEGVLTAAEQRAVRDAVVKAERPLRLPSVLAALHDAAAELLGDDLGVEFGHIVVDEAQDLSPVQLRMIARRAREWSVTLLGDFDQRTVATGNDDWTSLVAGAGLDVFDRRTLETSYRVPSDVLAFASAVLPAGAATPTGVRDADEPIRVVDLGGAAYHDVVGATVKDTGTVGVVCSARSFDQVWQEVAALSRREHGRVACLPVEDCKGLEFNHVVVVDPAGMVAHGERATGRLYTALTRAISTLVVLHRGDLPARLRGREQARYGTWPPAGGG